VGEGSFDGDSFVRVEGQQFLEEVDSVRVGSLEDGCEVLPLTSGQLLNEFLVLLDLNFVHQVFTGTAYQVCYDLNLFFLRNGWQERLPGD